VDLKGNGTPRAETTQCTVPVRPVNESGTRIYPDDPRIGHTWPVISTREPIPTISGGRSERGPWQGRDVKVVLFCGGQGLRLREYSEAIPKPMAPIGLRPILWHVMRYYAHFGHNEFVLALGHKAEVVKEYFLRYSEALSNDFVLSDGGRRLDLLSTDIEDWRITFADTGLNANIGQRLMAVRRHLAGEEMFLANYGDGLTDAPLDVFVDDFVRRGQVAAFLAVRPAYSFHVATVDDGGLVTSINHIRDAGMRVNGGFFILRKEIFDYMKPGEELVEEPFQRLIDAGLLAGYQYDGFWAPMDTLKEMQNLEALYQSGRPPWAVWQVGDESPG
jgi:glucose-1-phosphate cytidylyltransferase